MTIQQRLGAWLDTDHHGIPTRRVHEYPLMAPGIGNRVLISAGILNLQTT